MCFGKNSKMNHFHLLPLVVLLIHASVNAAPSQSDIAKLEDIAKVETADLKLDAPVSLEDATNNDKNAAQGQRQKRFYDHYGYGFSPINPPIYPSYPNNNDPYQNNYGEDPLQQIYRRLQDIAGVIRTQPNFNQPPQPRFPILFPVIFVPQIGCGCTPNQGTTPKPNKTVTDFDIENRFPDMEDTNQNWGIVVNQNETEVDDGQDEDFTRPISFQPIRPNRTMNRPPPAVDHGSNQEGRDSVTTTTTVTPPAAAPASSASAPTRPTACDAAVLSCCHQAQVTYDCFVANGCPDPTSYGNPCDAQIILQVINRFSRFYGQRTG